MTAIVPRRLFDESEDDSTVQIDSHDQSQEVRATGDIPIWFNERLKAMARRQGKTASQLIGELMMLLVPVLEKWEAEQEAIRLRKRFGPQWMELLAQASSPSQPPHELTSDHEHCSFRVTTRPSAPVGDHQVQHH